MRPVLLDYVESLGHTVFESGQYNLNIIGIRSKDHKANSFDDRMCVVFRDEQGWVTRTWECTTEPGKYWLENPSIIDAEVGTEEEGYFGINIHKAGTASTQVDKWSAGCQVFSHSADFDEFMSICYAAKDKWGDSFSYTLIEEPVTTS